MGIFSKLLCCMKTIRAHLVDKSNRKYKCNQEIKMSFIYCSRGREGKGEEGGQNSKNSIVCFVQK